jgi:hypothetical protein
MVRTFAYGYAALLALLLSVGAAGCSSGEPPPYGVERPLYLNGRTRQTWAVAPVIDLSGQHADPILQADNVYVQLQQVAGLNVIPVNRVVEVYQTLRIGQVQSEEQAALVCELLGADALCVVSVTVYDPYDPPKLGASMHLFRRNGSRSRADSVDPRDLVRRASPPVNAPAARDVGFAQVVGMYDASNGSTRAELLRYVAGRNDPVGPLKERAYLVEMDRYCGFVYYSLIEQLLRRPGAAGD